MPTPFLARKEQAIGEDLKTAFSGYDRLVRQVGEVRTWTVTIEVAALGLLLSGKLPDPVAAFVPAALALASFLLLELRARTSMRFNKNEVVAIERMQMIEGDAEYATAIQQYEFRDLRLSRLDRAQKITHLIASLFDLNVALWYGFWTTILVFEHFHFR